MLGEIVDSNGMQKAEPSIIYDGVIVPDGENLDRILADGVSKHYILEAYKHLKPIVFLQDKKQLVEYLGLKLDEGIFIEDHFNDIQEDFKKRIQHHRIWSREAWIEAIPA